MKINKLIFDVSNMVVPDMVVQYRVKRMNHICSSTYQETMTLGREDMWVQCRKNKIYLLQAAFTGLTLYNHFFCRYQK
jgi:hypothetical protein